MQYSGLLKFLKRDSGYGFIRPDTGGADHFVHYKDIQSSGLNPDQLEDGQTRLSYELEQTRGT